MTTKTKESHSNRGMDLEKKLNNVINQYLKDGIATIYKVPTDWTVIRKGKNIVSAFPKQKSIVDYIGAYKGKSIAIEAKRTNNKTSFPFDNIKDHQWVFFEKWQGLGYYIVWFKELNRVFLVESSDMQNARDTLDRKSAPFSWFEENCIEINKDMDFIKYVKGE
jgi:recombination protein U